jgi:hypothetical protein
VVRGLSCSMEFVTILDEGRESSSRVDATGRCRMERT